MTATYRIVEVPSGAFLLEKVVPETEGKLWIHVAEFRDYNGAVAGMERAIVMATWLFDGNGDYLGTVGPGLASRGEEGQG